MEKLKIPQVIVVEGKYDKIKLSSLIDGCIVTTDGFGVFKNKEKIAFLRRLAEKQGLIVLTDPDGAGLVIRNYFRSLFPAHQVVHLYVPACLGKERRKDAPSKEGLLGVEGSDAALLRALFLPFAENKDAFTPKGTEAGAFPAVSPRFQPHPENAPEAPAVTAADFFNDGLKGSASASFRRKALAKALKLPENLSAKSLLEAINLLGGRSFYESGKQKAGL